MKRIAIVALIGVNVALLLALVLGAGVPNAHAQEGFFGAASYMMATGKQPGGNTEALYIVDVAQQRMLAFRFNRAKLRLVKVGVRDFKKDFRPIGMGPRP